MNNILQRLVTNSFMRNVFIISSASVMAQLINIASMPLLSRLYSPEDFGVLSLFTSIVDLFAMMSGFRYHFVLPLARRKRYVFAVICLSVLLQATFAIVLLIVTMLLGSLVIGTRYASLYPYRFLIPICVFAIGFYSMTVQWAIREKSFSSIARTKLAQTFAACAVKIAGALLGARPLGLLLAHVVGQSCGGITLMRHITHQSGRLTFNPEKVKRAAISYRNMLLVDTPGTLLNMAGTYMLPLVLAYFYSDDIVGSYAMAQNLLVLPSVIVGHSIGQVFSQKAAEANYNGSLGTITGKTFELLASTGLFPVLLCAIFAPEIFTFAFGEKWLQAGYFASVLGPWVAINFIYAPMNVLFTTLMIQKVAFVFTTAYTIVRLGSIAIFGGGDPCKAVVALSTSGSIMMLIGIVLLLSKAKVDKIPQRIGKVSVTTVLALSPVLIFSLFGDRNLMLGVLALFASVLIYIFLMLRSYRIYKP